MDMIKQYDRMLSGIIDANNHIEAAQARLNTIAKAEETCKANEYILTLKTISERISPVALYNFVWLYLENRRHNLDYDCLYVKVKMLGDDTGFIELHSAITGECLEWRLCEGVSQTESVRP